MIDSRDKILVEAVGFAISCLKFAGDQMAVAHLEAKLKQAREIDVKAERTARHARL